MKKRILSLLLCILMLSALVPMAVTAASDRDVTAIAITGVTAPVPNAMPDGNFTVDTSGLTKAQDGRWYNVTDGCWLEGKPFEAGKTYRFCAYVKIATTARRQWPSNLSGVNSTINGKTARVNNANPLTNKSVEVEFNCTGVISFVEITGVTPPVAGAKPNTDFTILTAGVKNAGGSEWFNVTDNKAMSGEAFEGGKRYRFNAHVIADVGYEWPPEYAGISVKMNGRTAGITIPALKTHVVVRCEFECAMPTVPKYTLTAKVEGGHGSILTGSSVTLNAGETTSVIFEPDDGYMIDKVTVNDKNVDVLSNVLDVTLDGNKTLIVTYKKVPETVKTISALTVTGVSPVKAGRAASETLEVPEGCHYSVYDYYWFETNIAHQLAKDETFDAGGNYKLCVMFKTEPGYTISDIRTADVNVTDVSGKSVALNTTRGYNASADYYYVWTEEEAPEPADSNLITSVTVTGMKHAKIGREASETLSVPDGSPYYISHYYWFHNSRATSLRESETFADGTTYQLFIQIKAQPGYTLSEIIRCEVTDASGNPVTVADNSGYNAEQDYYFIWTAKESPEPAGDDANFIDFVGVMAVAEPVDGEKPNNFYMVPCDGAESAGDGEWYNITDDKWTEDEPFEAGKTYRFYAYVIPEEGYVWPEGEVFVTMNAVAAEYQLVTDAEDLRRMVFKDFVCPGGDDGWITITSVDVTGIHEPVTGAFPDGSFTIDTNGVWIEDNAAWYNVTDGVEMTEEQFEPGKTYEVITLVNLGSGCKWPDDLSGLAATVNGRKASVSRVKGESYLRISAQFTTDPNKGVVSTVDVTGVRVPAPGAMPDVTFTVTGIGVTPGEDSEWFNETDDRWMEGNPFEAGKTYIFYATVVAESGFVWSDNEDEQRGTMNGETAQITYYTDKEDPRRIVYCSFTCSDGTDVPGAEETGTADTDLPGTGIPDTDPGKTETKASLGWLWALIGVVVGGGGGAAAVILGKKKK